MSKTGLYIQQNKSEKTTLSSLVLTAAALISAALYILSFCNMAGVKQNAGFALSSIGDGAKAYFNLIFEKSESLQNYAYRYFEVTDAAAGLNAFVFLFAVVIIALMMLAALKRIKAVPIALITVLALFEVYFGIAPNSVLNVITFSFFIAFTLLCRKQGSAKSTVQMLVLAVVITAVISLFSFAVYPNEYQSGIPAVNSAAETVRDIFDEGEQLLADNSDIQQTKNDNTDDAKDDGKTDAQKEEGNDNGLGGTGKKASNPTRVYLTVAHVVIWAVIALLPLSYLVLFAVKTVRRKKKLTTADGAFFYSMRWLEQGGIVLENKMLSDYEAAIETLYSPALAQEYCAAVTEFEKLKYSRTPNEKAAYQALIGFYRSANAETMKRLNFIRKLKVKLIHFM